MNIILVSDSLARSRPLVLTKRHLAAAAVTLFMLPVLLAGVLFYATLRYAAETDNPYVHALVTKVQSQQAGQAHAYLQNNLDALAIKLGQMQAQLMRLNAVGKRLVKAAGLKADEFNFGQQPGEGGPAMEQPESNLTLQELNKLVAKVSSQLDDRGDQLAVLDSVLSRDYQQRILLPTARPISTRDWESSDFGWRIDPFTGRKSFHPGIDFAAEIGTPIYAAANGVVVYSGFYPEYGNMVEIDHGNGLTSRYAHTSKVLVKVGDIVLRGQKIALVGSTGRSTGPHLHFEVRYKGVALDPAKFLAASSSPVMAENLARQYQAAR